MGRHDFFKKKICIMIIALLLAPIFALIPGEKAEAEEVDNRVGHLYCNFKDAAPNNSISDLEVNKKYIFSNKKLERTYASTTFEPSFSIFTVDINKKYIGNESLYDNNYYDPTKQNVETKTKAEVYQELSGYINHGYSLNVDTEIKGPEDCQDNITIVTGMLPEHVDGGVTITESLDSTLKDHKATISYIADKTPVVIIPFDKLIILTHYEVPGWYVSTGNGLYSYLGPTYPYTYDYLEYKVSDVKISKSEKWVEKSGEKKVSKDELIVSAKVGSKYYEITDYAIKGNDNTVNSETGDCQISIIVGEGTEEYTLSRNISDLAVSDNTGALESYSDTIHENIESVTLTAEERLIAANGGSVFVDVKVSDNISPEGKTAIQKALLKDRMIGQELDLSVVKTITERNGNVSTVYITEPKTIVHKRIVLNSKVQGKTDFLVYRYHQGVVDILRNTSNVDGESFSLSSDGKYIDIYAKKFSDYVITYLKDEDVDSGTVNTGGTGGAVNNNSKVNNLNETAKTKWTKRYLNSPKTGEDGWMILAEVSLEIWGAVFCLVTMLITMFRSTKRSGKVLGLVLGMNVVVLISDAIAHGFEGLDFEVARFLTSIGFTLSYVFGFVLLAFVGEYIYQILVERGLVKNRFKINLIHVICLIGIIMIILSQQANVIYEIDLYNNYHRKPGWILFVAIYAIVIGIGLFAVGSRRKSLRVKERRAMLSYVYLPLIGLVVQIFYEELSFINIGTTLAIMSMYISNEVEELEEKTRIEVELAAERAESERKSAEVEKQRAETERQRLEKERKMHEAFESKMNLLLGQMQPHFVYNSLATIRALVIENPDVAVETIDHFSSYLRGSLSITDGTKLVPFSVERKLVDDYLYMEKQRFGDKIKIVEEIETEDFLIPPLSIQTLVENAVRHGLRSKNTVGTLVFSTKQDEENFYVLIEDDGIGFDTIVKNDGKHHIGTASTRARIKEMLDGRMLIQSELGQGTKIVIEIPKVSVDKYRQGK